MKSLTLVTLALLTAVLVTPQGVAWAQKSPPKVELPREGFEVIGEKGGVVVYQNDSAHIIWVGAVGFIPAPPERVQAALMAFDDHPGRIGRVSEARILSRDDEGLYVYERLNLPVISDRDFVARVTEGTEGDRKWIAYWAVTDHGPPARDGVVRVTRERGVWDLLPVAGGKMALARYELRIDLGGSIPLWMVRPHTADQLPELYKQVCRLSVGQAEWSTCG